MSQDDFEKKDDAVLVALLAAILLSGRSHPEPGGPAPGSLAMLEGEKRIAIAEATYLLSMARKASGL